MSPFTRRRLLSFVACLGLAVAPPLLRADDAPTGRKYALLVGVRNYNKDQLRSLKYTENDVNDLAAVLTNAGYKRVVLMTQAKAVDDGDNSLLPTARNVRKQLAAVLDDRKPGDSVLIAFSGHGVQFRDRKESYFCPMDAELGDLKTLVSLAEVYKGMEECPAGTKVLLVDACRNDPQAEASKAVDKVKLESVTRPQTEKPPGGVAALFSCSEGQRSYESAALEHGVFFHYVIEGLRGDAANRRGEVTLQGLTAYVTDEVPDAVKDVSTEARQRPQLVGDLSGAALLAPFVNRDEVRNSLGMKLKLIKPGKFLMGSPADDKDRDKNEGPQHEVEITKPFYMGVYPVTRAQFAAFVKAEDYTTDAETNGKGGIGYTPAGDAMGPNPRNTWRHPGFEQADDHPVVHVSWNDASRFCAWLSKKEGKTYALPTEAEWEYACRAGTTTRFWWGDRHEDAKGKENVADASLKRALPTAGWTARWDDGYPFTSPVGALRPNPWGLYDMNGNVRQWCGDRFGPYLDRPAKDPKGPDEGKSRVARGCTWDFTPEWCGSATRLSCGPDFAIVSIGFRVVLRPGARTP